MNLAEHSPPGVPKPFRLLVSACFFALIGCGGSVYSLGNAPDGGHAGDGSPPEQTSTGNNFGCTGSDCDAGTSPVTDGASTIAEDDAGTGITSSTDAGSATITGPSCTTNAPVACSAGATGYACTSGNPEEDSMVDLSCSSGTIAGAAVDYCCFPWPGAGGPCAPFPGFPCDDNSYAYQCVPGTLPSSVDTKLSCGTNFPDSNGNDDYCCTYQ